MTLPEILERIHKRLDRIEAKVFNDDHNKRLAKIEKELADKIEKDLAAKNCQLDLPCIQDDINPPEYEERGI